MDTKLLEEIRRFALDNAAGHGGQTREGTIISRMLGAHPELRDCVRDVSVHVADIVKQVNELGLQEQRAELARMPPPASKPTPRQQSPLPELHDAVRGQVITRFPPEPNGYPHIGHAKAAIINSEYVKMYGGTRILRLDDTNPENELMEYYAAIKVGLEWLGIRYDIIKNTSDDMDLICKKGLHMIESGAAYVCTCKRDAVARNRQEKKTCKCRMLAADKNLERWHGMFEKFKQGEAVARFCGDMGSDNTVMRDPVLFRIMDARHPLAGDRYRVWPSYDMAVAIEDSIDGVTHAFRSKEYELRNELYYSILDTLGMRKPRVLEFSRLAFEGMPVSKRILKDLITQGKVSGYDDPRLPTLEALRRRGIRPEAVNKFILSLGFTKSDTLAPFDALEAFNRRIIDDSSIRLNLVCNPHKVTIRNLPHTMSLANHPTVDMGARTIHPDDGIFLDGGDCQGLTPGSRLRLIGLGNITITSVSPGLEATYDGDSMDASPPKVQWVAGNDMHRIRIIKPGPLYRDGEYDPASLHEEQALTERHYLSLETASTIQFIRFGYCIKESPGTAIYTHR